MIPGLASKYHSLLAKSSVFLLVCLFTWFGLAAWRPHREARAIQPSPNDQGLLIANPSVIKIEAAEEADPKRSRTSVTIINDSDRLVKIRDVQSSCTCTVPGEITGSVVPPRGRIVVPLSIELPRFGFKRIKVEIYSDQRKEPLTIPIEARGADNLPVILSVSNRNPVFFDTSNLHEIQKTIIKTCEKINSRPWFSSFSSANPDLAIELANLESEVSDENAIILRTYQLRISIKNPPQSKDILVKYWPMDAEGKKLDLIGHISGSKPQG